MAKKIVAAVAILTALSNVFFFLQINRSVADKLLMNKAVISFHFYPYMDMQVESKAEFLEKIKAFSAKNSVEIAQYSFLNSDKIDIYSTMGDNYKELLTVPDFIFNRNIEVHDFEEIIDIGFKNVFYVDTNDMDILKSLSELLENDCKVYHMDTGYNNDIFSLNKSFFQVICFFILALILIVFFYYSISQKTYSIYHLWGYTDAQIYRVLNMSLYKAMFLTMVLSNLVMNGILYRSILSSLQFKIFTAMLKLNAVIALVIFILSFPLFRLFCTVTDSNSRKRRFTKIIVLSYFSKILLFLFLILSFEHFFYQSAELKEKLDSLSLWENTRNLFNIFEAYYLDDLALEDVLNDKVFRVYKELSDLDKVFIMKTLNFERPDTEDFAVKDPKDIDYSYRLNVEKTEDLYSPYGKNIVVDKNYLKKHMIRSIDGKNVIDLIDYRNNVLNILVPIKFEEYENTIKDSFKEWFYFQKMEVTNLYKEARGQDKIEIDMDDLKVNMIYIENSQNLFTYNHNSGDQFNIIEDSIITVYTENIDHSYLASCFGRYIFLEADDEYSALKEISAISLKYNVIELNTVSSVYDQKGEEIRIAEVVRNNLILNIIFAVLFLAMLMIVIVYAYHKAFFPIIMITSLHGHSFWQTYGHLILLNLFTNVFALFLAGIVSKKMSFYMIIIVVAMSVMDHCISKIVNRCLISRGEIQFIRET